MKPPSTFLLCIILVLLVLGRSCAQSSTSGTDFWVTNLTYWSDNSSSSLTLEIVAPRQCTALISNPNTGLSTTVTVPSEEGILVDLGSNFRHRASDTIQDFVFHVTSTDSISLFAIDANGGFFDKSIILPTSLLDDEYIVQTFGQNLWGSEFQVVAVEDNTVLSITPSVATRSGRPPGVPYTVTIPQAGQCLQVISSNNMDFTGTVVRSMNEKPFALFQGVSCLLSDLNMLMANTILVPYFTNRLFRQVNGGGIS